MSLAQGFGFCIIRSDWNGKSLAIVGTRLIQERLFYDILNRLGQLSEDKPIVLHILN